MEAPPESAVANVDPKSNGALSLCACLGLVIAPPKPTPNPPPSFLFRSSSSFARLPLLLARVLIERIVPEPPMPIVEDVELEPKPTVSRVFVALGFRA